MRSRKGKDGRKQGKGGKRERRCFRCGERTHLMADCKVQVKPAADQVEQPPKAGESPGLALIADVSDVSGSSEFEVWI